MTDTTKPQIEPCPECGALHPKQNSSGEIQCEDCGFDESQIGCCPECGSDETSSDCFDGDNFENECIMKCADCGWQG